ncbi:MAG: sulfotransferase domain-containing protein [Candidatus Poribacteria bacterium]|nr:sulfotransferase domain-containing protein [Candidatus Poribacteria bacterium]
MPSHPALNRQQSFSPYIRYPVLFLTYALIKPLLWLGEKLGFATRIWRMVGRNMVKQLTMGRDFGDYQPTPHDVIINAFPKCGQNWTMQIAYQIAMRGQGEFEHIHDVIPWPEGPDRYAIPLSADVAGTGTATGHRIIKTHLDWERVPYSEEARYIGIIRDPKDAFVSNYHFIRDCVFGPLMPSVATWLAVYLSPDSPVVWAPYQQGYWQARHRPNLLMLTFEEMKADLPQAVRQIADFMGVQLTDREFTMVCEKSSFAYMKGIDHKFVPPALTPWSSANRQMVRKGQSGGASELLSLEQQQAIDTYCKGELQRLHCDFPYDEVWGGPRRAGTKNDGVEKTARSEKRPSLT